MGTSRVGDAITSPVLWTNSGLLFRGCSQQEFPRQCFLGFIHSGNAA